MKRQLCTTVNDNTLYHAEKDHKNPKLCRRFSVFCFCSDILLSCRYTVYAHNLLFCNVAVMCQQNCVDSPLKYKQVPQVNTVAKCYKWLGIMCVLTMCMLCVLPAAFPPAPATSGPPPSAAVVSSAVPPLTGTVGLHTAACLLPCPTNTHTNMQRKTSIATEMHTKKGTHTHTQSHGWKETCTQHRHIHQTDERLT